MLAAKKDAKASFLLAAARYACIPAGATIGRPPHLFIQTKPSPVVILLYKRHLIRRDKPGTFPHWGRQRMRVIVPLYLKLSQGKPPPHKPIGATIGRPHPCASN